MALNDRCVVLDVLPKGSTFLDFMVELGHLNENLVQKINQKLLRIRTIDGQISLDDVRRIVAEVLFENMDELEPGARKLLKKEWPLFF